MVIYPYEKKINIKPFCEVFKSISKNYILDSRVVFVDKMFRKYGFIYKPYEIKFHSKLYLTELMFKNLYETINNLNVTDELKSYSIQIIDGRKKIRKLNMLLNENYRMHLCKLLDYSLNRNVSGYSLSENASIFINSIDMKFQFKDIHRVKKFLKRI